MIKDPGIPGPDEVVRQLRRSVSRRFSFFLVDALVVAPLYAGAVILRAKHLEKAHLRGRTVTVRMARRARPQDSWMSGRFTAGAAARWRVAKEGEWVPVAGVAAERPVGNSRGRGGVVIFTLRDGAEVSVNAIHARLVRTALTEAAGLTGPAGSAVAAGTDEAV